MRTRKHQYSFAGGEVSPEFYGRGDSVQYQTGVATARNFLIKPQGSARTRPGFEHVDRAAVQDSASQLIPFLFDLEQAYVVAFSDSKIRFYSEGASVKWGSSINAGDLQTPGPDAVLTPGTDVSTDPDPVRYGTIRTRAAHGLSDGDYVTFKAVPVSGGGGAFLPDPIVQNALYQVTIVDARRFMVSFAESQILPNYPTLQLLSNQDASSNDVAGILSLVRVTAISNASNPDPSLASSKAYVGDARVYTPQQLLTFNANSSRIDLQGNTALYEVGDAIQLDTAVAPNFEANKTYYVAKTYGSDGSIRLSETPGGPWIGNTGSTASNIVAKRRYFVGDLIYSAINIGPTTAYLGRAIYCTTEHTGETATVTTTASGGTESNWVALPEDGTLEIPSPYSASDVFDLNYDQSGDVLTLVHPDHPERELRRRGRGKWAFEEIQFSPTVAAPDVTVTSDYGVVVVTDSVQTSNVGSEFYVRAQDLAAGDVLLCVEDDYVEGSGNVGLDEGEYYILNSKPVDASNQGNQGQNFIFLRRVRDGVVVDGNSDAQSNSKFAYSDLVGDNNKYRVAAVDTNGVENLSDETDDIVNNLLNSGASNTLTWPAVTDAEKYVIYRKSAGAGIYSKIGETEDTTFVDSDLPADSSLTAPRLDNDITTSTNYSRATAHFEQRRCFAGSDLFPRRLFMSRSGTENDFSFRIPVVDDDRISVEVAAREAHTIRHIVPLGDLLLLTQLGEWRLFAINSDAITPTTVSVRPQSYVGASTVRPQVVNNSVIYCAARGGHVREMGYNASRQGFSTGDMSLRAAHLFDDFEIQGSAYQKAPFPVVWFVSTSGKLLGLTYVPEEEVGAWHQHDTDGTVESVACIPEGEEDRVYVTIKRTVGGATVRNVERMSKANLVDIFDTRCVDDTLRYDGAGSGTLTITSGGANIGDEVTITSSAVVFSDRDVGRRILIGTQNYAVEVTEWLSLTSVKAKLVDAIPTTSRNVAISSWAFAATTISGLDYLEGETVRVVRATSKAGPVVSEDRTVSGGKIVLGDYATIVDVGRSYTCDLRLLPVTLQIAALGYGREKAVNHAWLRVYEAAGLSVGPDEDNLTLVSDLQGTGKLEDRQTRSLVPTDWSPDAQLLIRQTQSLPATVAAVTIEVSIAE